MKYLLFSIPIYNTTPKQFQKRVDNHHMKFKQNSSVDEEYSALFYSMRYGKKTLRENYIIGFLNVNYHCGCLEYDILLCTTEKYDKPAEIESNIASIDRKIVGDEEYAKMIYCYRNHKTTIPYSMPLFTEKKHYFSKEPVMGFHTPIDSKSNKEVYECIKTDIILITAEQERQLYFDLDNFYRIAPFIDYNSLFEQLQQKYEEELF